VTFAVEHIVIVLMWLMMCLFDVLLCTLVKVVEN
jgi:hypothetical protein